MTIRSLRYPVLMLALLGGASLPAMMPTVASAQARVGISTEFRLALERHGRFIQHRRWGEVWAPSVARDWRPYTRGHWVYSADYGWYWNSDTEEAPWGVVVFHYGRWVLDPDDGWIWVSGQEWAPAWVNWRRGSEDIGWAPLAPEGSSVEVIDQPDAWVFVRSRDFAAPRIYTVLEPSERVILERTVVVNRTVIVRDRDFAVDPGIEPGIVAAALGRPIRSVEVRPLVFGTARNLPGEVVVRADEMRGNAWQERLQREPIVREGRAEIAPSAAVPPPQALGHDENGRLGHTPPRLAGENGTGQGGQQRPGTSGSGAGAGQGTTGTEARPDRRPPSNRQGDENLERRGPTTPGASGGASEGGAGQTKRTDEQGRPSQRGTPPGEGRAGDRNAVGEGHRNAAGTGASEGESGRTTGSRREPAPRSRGTTEDKSGQVHDRQNGSGAGASEGSAGRSERTRQDRESSPRGASEGKAGRVQERSGGAGASEGSSGHSGSPPSGTGPGRGNSGGASEGASEGAGGRAATHEPAPAGGRPDRGAGHGGSEGGAGGQAPGGAGGHSPGGGGGEGRHPGQ